MAGPQTGLFSDSHLSDRDTTTGRVLDAAMDYAREHASELTIRLPARVGDLRTRVSFDFLIRLSRKDLDEADALRQIPLLECHTYWPPETENPNRKLALVLENVRTSSVTGLKITWDYAPDNSRTRFFVTQLGDLEDREYLTVRLQFDSIGALFEQSSSSSNPDHHGSRHTVAEKIPPAKDRLWTLEDRAPFIRHTFALGVRLSPLSPRSAIVAFHYPRTIGFLSRFDNAHYCSNAATLDSQFEQRLIFFDTTDEHRQLSMRYRFGTVDATELCAPMLPPLRGGLAGVAAGLAAVLHFKTSAPLLGPVAVSVLLAPWFVDCFAKHRPLYASASTVRVSADDFTAFFSFAINAIWIACIVIGLTIKSLLLAYFTLASAGIVLLTTLTWLSLVLLFGAFMGYKCDWCPSDLPVRRAPRWLSKLGIAAPVHDVGDTRSTICRRCEKLLTARDEQALQAFRELEGLTMRLGHPRQQGQWLADNGLITESGREPTAKGRMILRAREIRSYRSPQTHLIISATVPDRVALVRDVARAIKEADGVVEVAKHAVMLGQSAFLFYVIGPSELTKERLTATIIKQVPGATKEHLQVFDLSDAGPLVPTISDFARAHFYGVVPEQAGVLARIATVVKEHRGWIEDATTYVVAETGNMSAIIPAGNKATSWPGKQDGEIDGPPDGRGYGVIDMGLWIPQVARNSHELMDELTELGAELGAKVWDFVPSCPAYKLVPEITETIVPSSGSEVAVLSMHVAAGHGVVADVTKALADQGLTIVASMMAMVEGRIAMMCMLQEGEGRPEWPSPKTRGRQRASSCGTASVNSRECKRQRLKVLADGAMKSVRKKHHLSYIVDLGDIRHHAEGRTTVCSEISRASASRGADAPSLDAFSRREEKTGFARMTLTAYSGDSKGNLLSLASRLAKYSANVVQLRADSPDVASRRIEVDFDMGCANCRDLYDALKDLRGSARECETSDGMEGTEQEFTPFTSIMWNSRPVLSFDLRRQSDLQERTPSEPLSRVGSKFA